MRFLRLLIQHIIQDDCAGLAAEMSYHLMLAAAPALIFIVTVFGLVDQQADITTPLLDYASQLIPHNAFELVQTSVKRIGAISSEELAIASFLAALWVGSNGAMVAAKALNRALGIGAEGGKTNYLRQRLLAMGVVLSLGVTLFIGSNLLVVGSSVTELLIRHFPLDNNKVLLGQTVQWLVFVVLVTTFSAIFYRVVPGAPNYQLPWRYTIPGALTFVLLWLITSLLFSLYVDNIARFGEIYGALGAVAVLLIWFYVTAFAFLIGGEVNATYRNQDDATAS